MALQDSDLLLVGRSGGSFRCTASDLQTYVQSGDGLTYRGTVNLNNTPVGQLNPAVPAVGDLYINDTAVSDGNIDGNWTGLSGAALVGDRVLWNGSAWELITSGQTPDVGVTLVNVADPITKSGTDAQPTIGIRAATNSVNGAVQLADNTYEADGTINTTTTATDVLTGTHFDVLAGRIQTAAGGGIQDVNGSNGVTASVTSGTATVTGIDGTTSAKGVVQLTDSVAANSTLSVTGTAVRAFAVPLDLSTLSELT